MASPRSRIMAACLALLLLALATPACSRSSGEPPLTGTASVAEQGARKSWAGTQPAPPFPPGLTWFNVQRPLALEQLRGRIVLLDFWTAGCINCQHIIPDLHRLEAEFGDTLVVIGVHSGKYAAEHDDETIRQAVARFGITHPVLNDADFQVWRTFGARAWPTLVLIDPAGNLVGYHEGEGVYPLFQPILASLRDEFGARGLLRREPLPLAPGAPPAAAALSFPADVAASDTLDRLYIADAGNHRIIETSRDGRILRVFGTGEPGFADGSPGEAAFRQPQGLALSPDSATLYVADTRNHAVRAIDLASGAVTTIAGTGRQLQQLPRGQQPARQVDLASPWDLVQVGQRLYITMAGVHQVWLLDLASGAIDIFAGTSREGIDDGPRRTLATLAQPSGITADSASLYWVDPESSSVRMTPLDGDGEVTTLVGTGLFEYGDADGPARQASLQHPQGITIAPGGALYIADTYNHRIRILDAAAGLLGTAAGSDRGWTDGPAGQARFNEPSGLALAGGLLYIADSANHLVRTFDPTTGQVGTLALTGLELLRPAGPGQLSVVELPAQEVAPGAANLRVAIEAPPGYHLNASGPSVIEFATSNPAVLEPGERRLQWQTNDPSVSFPVPVLLAPGEAVLTATLSAYYCREGQEALCFIERIELRLPLTVRPGAPAAEPALPYTLPGR